MKEYRTKTRLFGLPLVHIAARSHSSERPVGVARGWIAFGERAFGGLVAVGTVAVGPIAMGGFTIGGLSFSLVPVGGFAVGAIALGLWTWGGIAVGLDAAQGGVAVASRFADGVVAVAEHANDSSAERFFDEALAFSLLHDFLDSWILVVAATVLLLIPVGLFQLRIRDKGEQ